MPSSFTNTSNLHQSVQLLAEYLHTASGMHVGIHDFERRYEVAAGDDCENLCRFCRRTCTSFVNKCFCCDDESLAQVYRTGQRLIYRCHMGLTEVILPVTDEDQLLGVLFLGQVRIIPDESLSFENLYARLAAQYPEEICEENKPALKAAYENTAVMTQEKLESFIGLTVIAEKGTRVDHWLNHFKLTTKAIVRQYLEYYDLVHIPLAEFSVAAIAKQLNISYSQLNRISAELFGQPLKQYVLEVKVTAAADMLREHPELSVAGVASRVGIDNANYFSKVFQKRMGCRCSEYSKKWLQRIPHERSGED